MPFGPQGSQTSQEEQTEGSVADLNPGLVPELGKGAATPGSQDTIYCSLHHRPLERMGLPDQGARVEPGVPHAAPSRGPGLALWVPPEILLEMQAMGPHPTRSVGICILNIL